MTASTFLVRMQLWLKGPVEIKTDTPFVLVREARITAALLNRTIPKTRGTLYQMIEAAPNRHIFKKRATYLTAFTDSMGFNDSSYARGYKAEQKKVEICSVTSAKILHLYKVDLYKVDGIQ